MNLSFFGSNEEHYFSPILNSIQNYVQNCLQPVFNLYKTHIEKKQLDKLELNTLLKSLSQFNLALMTC